MHWAVAPISSWMDVADNRSPKFTGESNGGQQDQRGLKQQAYRQVKPKAIGQVKEKQKVKGQVK